MELSVRTLNALKAANIETVGDVEALMLKHGPMDWSKQVRSISIRGARDVEDCIRDVRRGDSQGHRWLIAYRTMRPVIEEDIEACRRRFGRFA